MAATYAEEITRICDELTRPVDELGAFAGQELLSAINFYDGYRFAFNTRILTCTFSATNTYRFDALVVNDATAEGIMQIDDVKVQQNGRDYTVEKLPWGEFWQRDLSNQTSSVPDYWAVFDQNLHVYPTPNASITAVVTAHIRLLTIDGATVTTNAWLGQGEELVRTRACRMIAMRKLRNQEQAQIYAQLEGEALRSLQHENAMKHTSGILAPND